MRASPAGVIALVLLAAGCSGGAGGPRDVPGEIVIHPTWDVPDDPGTRDARDAPGTDASREIPAARGRGAGVSAAAYPIDVPAPRDLAEVQADVIEAVDASTDPSDLASDDLLPVDVPPDAPADLLPDPGATDTGHDLVEGACAPGSLTCWCEDETQCDPAYGEPCRPNRCNKSTGHCVLDSGFLEGQECDDGDFCTTGETCHKGNCVGGTTDCECHVDAECPDTDPCTDDACVLGHCQHVFNTAPCDDGGGCTAGDACAEGTCIPGPRVCQCDGDARCEDGISCTTDRCADGACTHVLDAATCFVGGACIPADAAEPGNVCRVCAPEVATDQWSSVLDGTACDDGNVCTAPDTCIGGACVPGARACECVDASECDDGNPCTDDTCPVNTCAHAPNTVPCDDGDPATLGDRCAAAACVPGIPCGDGTCARPGETCATCPADCGGACPTRETLCQDGWDDDLDGATDCADTDCQGLPPCTPDTCTKVDGNATCGMSLYYRMAYDNNLKGTASAACGKDSLSGDETIWKFVSPVTRQVTARTEASDPFNGYPVSVYVLSGACNPDTCIATDYGYWAEVTFTAEAGRPYYIVSEEIYYANEFDIYVTCS